MITRDRTEAILKLALPITVALLSNQIIQLVDMAMVSPLGNAAVAAIGTSTFIISVVLAFVLGFSPIVQGMVARRRGEDSTEPECLPLNGGLLLVFIIGIPLSILCYFFCPLVFSFVSSDSEVVREGVPYLRALFVAVLGMGVSGIFGSYWIGLGKTKVYMLIIIISNCLNIFLNYVLIYGNLGAPALGTAGAGIATAITSYVGATIYFGLTLYRFRADKFMGVKPKLDLLVRIFKLGLPGSIARALILLSYVVFFWMLAQIGTAELAATNVLIRIGLVLAVFPEALGIASATLVSNMLGKKDPSGAAQWGWDAGKICVTWSVLAALPIVLFPDWFLSFFLSDADTILMTEIPLQWLAISSVYASLFFIFAGTLTSVGDGKRVLIATFGMQWILCLPAVWIVGPYLNYGLLEIWIVRYASGLVGTVMLAALWLDGRWKEIKV